MAVFTIGGRIVAAQLFHAQTWFLGLGRGDPQWDSALVQPSPTLTDLVDKVGVTRCREVAYVKPDDAGDISMSDGAKFSRSDDPTRYLYLYFKLDLPDASPNTLRENGVYFGTALAAGIPAGQFYIDAADVETWGTLIRADRFNSIVRDGTIEQAFSMIITL